MSPLVTQTWGVVVGDTSKQAGSADCCRQCNVAAESSSATGCMGGDTTEIDDKVMLFLSL